MSYLKNSLTNGEELKNIFYLNKYAVFAPYFLIALSFGILILGVVAPGDIPWQFYLAIAFITFFSGLVSYFKIKSLEYGVTSHRVISKRGIIARNSEEILNKAVETVEISQPMLGRILDYGDVYITGRGNSVVLFKGVEEPLKVKQAVEEAVFGDN